MACLFLVEEVSVLVKQLLASRGLTPKVVIQGDISPSSNTSNSQVVYVGWTCTSRWSAFVQQSAYIFLMRCSYICLVLQMELRMTWRDKPLTLYWPDIGVTPQPSTVTRGRCPSDHRFRQLSSK